MVLCSIVGIAAGVIGVVALVKRIVFGRRFGRCGGGGGYGRRRWGRRGPGGSFWLRAIFAELDTTPGQEREIRLALEELRDTAREAKSGLFEARADVARAMTGAEFDDLAFAQAGGRADAVAAKVKEAVTATLRRVHGVLDPRQRERLAELLAKGPWGGGFRGGPYRSAAT